MTTQPEWSGAVQRELDGLQRSVDQRFTDFSNRLDKLLTLTEYYADKRGLDLRFTNINEKLEDSENDLRQLATEVRQSLADLRTAISNEGKERDKSFTKLIDERKSQFRWLVSMVMIPIAVAIVDLVVKK
jgi:hypothetical protein